jgi:hypothetical protein
MRPKFRCFRLVIIHYVVWRVWNALARNFVGLIDAFPIRTCSCLKCCAEWQILTRHPTYVYVCCCFGLKPSHPKTNSPIVANHAFARSCGSFSWLQLFTSLTVAAFMPRAPDNGLLSLSLFAIMQPDCESIAMQPFDAHIGKGPETSKEALSGAPTRAAEHLTFPGLLVRSLFFRPMLNCQCNICLFFWGFFFW